MKTKFWPKIFGVKRERCDELLFYIKTYANKFDSEKAVEGGGGEDGLKLRHLVQQHSLLRTNYLFCRTDANHWTTFAWQVFGHWFLKLVDSFWLFDSLYDILILNHHLTISLKKCQSSQTQLKQIFENTGVHSNKISVL